MILRNKVKYQMYKTLMKFKKCNDISKTQNYICKKFNIQESDFTFIVRQCVENHFIDGINCSQSLNNTTHASYSEHIYLTYSGYEFMKNYYSFIKKLLWNLFLIITTAIVTVKVNDFFSKSNQVINPANHIVSNNTISVPVC